MIIIWNSLRLLEQCALTDISTGKIAFTTNQITPEGVHISERIQEYLIQDFSSCNDGHAMINLQPPLLKEEYTYTSQINQTINWESKYLYNNLMSYSQSYWDIFDQIWRNSYFKYIFFRVNSQCSPMSPSSLPPSLWLVSLYPMFNLVDHKDVAVIWHHWPHQITHYLVCDGLWDCNLERYSVSLSWCWH